VTTELLPFGPLELGFIGVYLLSLVAIGYAGYKARRENSLRDFYLAGRGVGFVVLLLTLYATQYSGNTLFGFSGNAYRAGYSFLLCVHFMTAIVVCYLLLAPGLFALAKEHGFITPTDFLDQRFGSPPLNIAATVIMIAAISNFLLAQLMAMGRALQGLTDYDPAAAYIVGVVLLSLIIVAYETLGGFRAVAWTDVIQGAVLFVGFAVLLGMVFVEIGSLADATRRLREEEQSAQIPSVAQHDAEAPMESEREPASPPAPNPSRVDPPGTTTSLEWLSYVLIVGLGGALYPQSIQRIYAARSGAVLRRSLAVMAFLPLTTALVAVIVGIIGAAHVPGLSRTESDQILTILCREVQQMSLAGRWLVVVLFAGILASIMSTADSVLLSISSMFTKDLYGRFVRPGASQAHLTLVGKASSWVLIVVLAAVAVFLRQKATLIDLLDRKFDLLVQLAPAFFLGLHWRKLRAAPTMWGMLAGTASALLLASIGLGKVAGIHAGLIGLGVNVAIAVGGSALARDSENDGSR
jgi:SSS family solute:Na+ symporter/sodium/pantothenate symporter